MTLPRPVTTTVALLALSACGPSEGGIANLGMGTHDLDTLELRVVLTEDDGLAAPTDLAFHPQTPDQLWVVNRATHGVVIADDATEGPAEVVEIVELNTGGHFLARPSGIAFGKPGFFATSHEEDRVTQPTTPGTFMGPTLWTSDIEEFEGGHASHYDMLHNSPNSAGIAWETGNIYWIYDGYHASFTKYDFHEDHGPGGSDHRDGEVRRYVEGQVGFRKNVPGNLVFDPSSKLLYAADAGIGRVVALDTTTGKPGTVIEPNFDGSTQETMEGAKLKVIATAEDLGMTAPSGLHLDGDTLYVTDFDSGRIAAITLDGKLIDWVDTGRALGGMVLADDGAIWVVDVKADEVLRIAALDE